MYFSQIDGRFLIAFDLVNLRHLHFAPSISGLPSVEKSIDADLMIDGDVPKSDNLRPSIVNRHCRKTVNPVLLTDRRLIFH